MPIILVLRRQSKWIFEFKTSLIYIKRSCPKKKKKKSLDMSQLIMHLHSIL